MPIILDIFGVAYTGVINKKMFEITDYYRSQGHKIYLASNVEASKTSVFMEDFGLKRHVDEIFCSGSLGVAKPAYSFYHEVTQRIDAQPDTIIFFDDSMANIDGAQAYGWHAHLYSSTEEMRHKIDNFLNLKGNNRETI